MHKYIFAKCKLLANTMQCARTLRLTRTADRVAASQCRLCNPRGASETHCMPMVSFNRTPDLNRLFRGHRQRAGVSRGRAPCAQAVLLCLEAAARPSSQSSAAGGPSPLLSVKPPGSVHPRDTASRLLTAKGQLCRLDRCGGVGRILPLLFPLARSLIPTKRPPAPSPKACREGLSTLQGRPPG